MDYQKDNNVIFNNNDEIMHYNSNEPIYNTNYLREIKSIKGSGKTSSSKKNITKYRTNVILDSYPKNKIVTPPLKQMILTKSPLEANGKAIQKSSFKKSYKIRDYYYMTQDYDNNDVDDDDIINYTNKKLLSNKKSLNNSLYIPKYINKYKPTYKPTYKQWYNNHFIYSIEPNFNDVINSNKTYTRMLPFSNLNTEHYYISNINNSNNSPIILSESDKIDQFNSSINPVENFSNNKNSIKCIKNYNIIYFIIIVIILCIYLNTSINYNIK